MSKLDELIQKLCPDGVEYKTLGELCDICGRIGFRGYTRQDQVDKGCGAISLSPSNIQEGEVVYENCTYISWFKYDESPEIQVSAGDIIFCKTASVGKTALIKELPEKATINPQLVLLKNITCDSAFLSYILKTKELQNKVNKIKGLGTIPTISQKDFANLTVPVPPLEVQREIVRILDNFTELTAALTAELTARKLQYEYYRENLLIFGEGHPMHAMLQEFCPDGVECFSVGEVCDIITDYTAAGSFADIAKNVKYINGGVGFAQLVRTTDLKNGFSNYERFVFVDEHAFKYLWRVNLNSEALVMPNVGNCGEVYYITKDLFPHEHNVLGPNAILVKSSSANIRFLYHLFLAEEFQKKLAKIVSPTGQTKFNKTSFKEIKIPVPPLEVQCEIVRILDNFSTLCNDISSGLPAEIKARQKQYEYYRDKLLTFEEVGA